MALKLGLPIQTPVLKGHEAQLATGYILKDAGYDVLICWEHHHIPAMVAALAPVLGVVEIPPAGKLWPDDDYCTALIFSRAGERYELRQVSQGVLDGD